jgi:4-amino-4-deoxy-L-arabinose transferase-like glycosyltransferase
MSTVTDPTEITVAPPVARPGPAPASPPAAGRPSRWRGLVRGRPSDPAWVRPALLSLLTLTAALYLFGLGGSGWANAFYAAAVQAGTRSWKAFFFGSFDSSSFITVDKPPASLWVMELSARLFGLNSWSLLVPQAMEGVASVGVVYLAVRRWFSAGAALLAGAVLALTPVAALMFRFDNPDALLVLLLTAAAYATVRAVGGGRTRWLVLAGTLLGLGFLTKMLQAFVVVPVFAAVYLLAGPPKLGRRLWQLVAGGAAMAVAGGWWVAVVELVPARDRPYIGGSQDNSLFNLVFGYNGLGRLTGNETGSVVGGASTGSPWGPTGWDRLFGSQMGGQISWLIPAALVVLAAGAWLTRRAARTDRLRAAMVLWGGWLLLTGALFSFGKGIIHPYYTVALAPAVAALIGIGSAVLWRRRAEPFCRAALAVALAATSVWSWVLLDRSPSWFPGLRVAVVVAGLALSVAVATTPHCRRRLAAGLAAAGLVAGLAGPAAYALDTAATPHSGSIPSAGPTVGASGPGGAGGPGGGAGRPVGPGRTGLPGVGSGAPAARNAPSGAGVPGAARRLPGGVAVGAPPAGAGGRGGLPSRPAGAVRGTGRTGAVAGGAGGLLNASTPSTALTRLLETDAGRYRWEAATVGANSAAGYQLATDDPVMAIGGFNGTDPTPTLAEFEGYVHHGDVHYFVAGGGGAGPGATGGSKDATEITTWVEGHFHAETVGGVTVYDLTRGSAT